MLWINSGFLDIVGVKFNDAIKKDINEIFQTNYALEYHPFTRTVEINGEIVQNADGFSIFFDCIPDDLAGKLLKLEDYVHHILIAEISNCDIRCNGMDNGRFILRDFGIEWISEDEINPLAEYTNEELFNELRRRGCSCLHCNSFDSTGYEPCDPDTPDLQVGYCNNWRRETQGCRTCSFWAEKEEK